MASNSIIPILRILDYQKAIEFYIDYLNFKIDWEHTFGDNYPVYMQISYQDIIIHLTEHYGDAVPGAKLIIYFPDLKEYHKILKAKDYKYLKPGIGKDNFRENTICVKLIDPFGNKFEFLDVLSQ